MLTRSASTSKAESENSHGDSADALSAINVGVGGENVRDGLGCVRHVCVGHLECVGMWLIKGGSGSGRIESEGRGDCIKSEYVFVVNE